MRRQIFGKPEFRQDEYGVSHLTYTPLQGLERIVGGLRDAVSELARMRLMFVPRPWPIGRRNRVEWALQRYQVGRLNGRLHNGSTDKMEGAFLVQVELRDFGSECPPPIKGAWPDRVLHWLKVALPLERMMMILCYTPEGFYVGDLDAAMRVYALWGLTDVQPFKVAAGVERSAAAVERKAACSVGFDPKHNAWVGWSHRGACVFQIGHVVEEGNCEASSGYSAEHLAKHPEEDLSVPVGFVVKTSEDSKRCAVAFAESVS